VIRAGERVIIVALTCPTEGTHQLGLGSTEFWIVVKFVCRLRSRIRSKELVNAPSQEMFQDSDCTRSWLDKLLPLMLPCRTLYQERLQMTSDFMEIGCDIPRSL
jgi:hypothetical protein